MITTHLHPSINNFLLNFIYKDNSKFLELERDTYEFYGLIPKLKRDEFEDDLDISTITFSRWRIAWGDCVEHEVVLSESDRKAKARVAKAFRIFGPYEE